MKQKRKKVFIHLDSGRGFSRELLRGIYEYNNQFTHWGIIYQSAYYLKPDDFSKVNLSMIRAHQPDGCILAYCRNIDELRKMGIPVIQTTSINQVDSIPYVRGNYDADGKMAVEYFLSIGFKNIGFFGINKLSWSQGRLDSVKKYCHQFRANLCVFDHETNLENINYNRHFNKVIKWLQSLPKPIGILASNDDFGQIVINACMMAGVKVPHEVAVLGVDNDELICNITSPNMSSISRNLTETAVGICSLLSEMIDGARPEGVAISTEPREVVVRQSTDTIASEDPEVIKAITFIRKNAHLPITVDQVVKETNLSKRRLYTRFKEVTGHNLYHEIRLTKLQRFKKLLKDSKQSIAEISYEMGFDDISHISRWFQTVEGVSPTEWRKNNCM